MTATYDEADTDVYIAFGTGIVIACVFNIAMCVFPPTKADLTRPVKSTTRDQAGVSYGDVRESLL